MLDTPVRRLVAPPLDLAAGGLVRAGVPAHAVTLAGWLVGVGACLAAGTGHWGAALLLWLTNRLLDGLDGAVARRTGATDLGGFLDIVADFSVYGGFVVAVGIERPEARVACLVLFLTYYLSGTAFLALSSVLERRGNQVSVGGRSLIFVGGLAEGTETVIAYTVLCLMPERAETVVWVFAVAVAITVGQRVALGVHLLRPTPVSGPARHVPQEAR
ncbi:MAG: CDP-alcohol phosphatidyltransferase family protein [Nocardioides sp.]|nr:CDP-alcohol phosphatidyltransferase family protein [Nocardioides sp.]